MRHQANYRPSGYGNPQRYYKNPLIIREPGDYSAITQALNAVQTGQTVIVRSGSHTVSSNLTVASGVALQVNSGATLTFTGNYKLRVEGTLTANGATFTSSGGTWYGIEFWNGDWLSEIR